MKKSILLFAFYLLLLPVLCWSQRKVYFDVDNAIVDSTAEYHYYHQLTEFTNGWTYVKRFDNAQHLEREGAYSNYPADVSHLTAQGLHKYYRKDTTTLFYTQEYKDGKPEGELRSYYLGGQLKRIEVYEEGAFSYGQCFNEDGSSRAFTPFQSVPAYPGGEQELMQFLKENMNYPPVAKDKNIQGTVLVTFVVNRDGSVSNVRILKDIGGGCGEEAVRVVRSMPVWQPGMADDQPVKVKYTLPLKFKLEDTRKKKRDKRSLKE